VPRLLHGLVPITQRNPGIDTILGRLQRRAVVQVPVLLRTFKRQERNLEPHRQTERLRVLSRPTQRTDRLVGRPPVGIDVVSHG
jgi:hypothetical protein